MMGRPGRVSEVLRHQLGMTQGRSLGRFTFNAVSQQHDVKIATYLNSTRSPIAYELCVYCMTKWLNELILPRT